MDIVEKARVGQGLDQCTLCGRAGIDSRKWRSLKSGFLDEDALGNVARALGLGVRGTLLLARGQYSPPQLQVEGLARVVTPFPQQGYPEGTSNAYIVYDKPGGTALVFDGGTETAGLFHTIEDLDLHPAGIFITHTHRDHIGGLPSLHSAFPDAPVRAHLTELISDCMRAIADGERLDFGSLKVEARHTPGHTPGGMSYVVQGLERPLAIVGDAMFAGSAGSAHGHWEKSLAALKAQIMTLPPETIICPGHGPLSTVQYERANSPLFPHLL